MITYDFEDGTDEGFGAPFGDDAFVDWPVEMIGGSMRMGILNDGDFQEAGVAAGGDMAALVMAYEAAFADPADYALSFDYYVDTSAATTPGSFLQIGTFFNAGDGTYQQENGGNVVEFGGGDLASGNVLSGTCSSTFAENGYFADPAANDFYRLGLILNGDGNQTVYFDNISIAPVPEPTSLALLGVGGLTLLRRRR